jgi:hypothetical protein
MITLKLAQANHSGGSIKKRTKSYSTPIYVSGVFSGCVHPSKPLKENKKRAIERISKSLGLPISAIRRKFIKGVGGRNDTFVVEVQPNAAVYKMFEEAETVKEG